jgi:hypothetical protein
VFELSERRRIKLDSPAVPGSYATVRVEDAQLVTRDQRMREFDAERTVW